MTPTQIKLLCDLLKEDRYYIHINLAHRLNVADMENNEENRITKILYDNSSRRKAMAFTKSFNINLFSLTSSEIQIIRKPYQVEVFNIEKARELSTFSINGIVYYKLTFEQIRLGDLAWIQPIGEKEPSMGIVSGKENRDGRKTITAWVIQRPITTMEELILVHETEIIVIEPLLNKKENGTK